MSNTTQSPVTPRHACAWFRRLLALTLFLIVARCAIAADVMPPAPTRYFNDYAGVVGPAYADQLNAQLDELERTSSNQIVVAVYPHMESNTSIEDYALNLYRAWKIGQKDVHGGNGALLLVFIQDRKMRIQTGYGLEGALPDITCKQIIDNEIAPHFKQADYAGGLAAGINAMIAATRDEYKGTRDTVYERQYGSTPAHRDVFSLPLLCFIFFLLVLIPGLLIFQGSRNGWKTVFPNGWWTIFDILLSGVQISSGGRSSGSNWSSGSGGGGWSNGGGGGGFSGGGGSSGGGGASGSW